MFMEGGEKTLTLDRSLVVERDASLLVKTATVFWNYNNVYKGFNDVVTYNGRKITIEGGLLGLRYDRSTTQE